MNIHLFDIEHSRQRYPTVGDWQIKDDGGIVISVSEMAPEDYCFLVALHELIEVWLCRKRGITQEAVDTFDIEYERNRPPDDFSEPGDSTKAPYFREHQFATMIEEQVASELGVDWGAYARAVEEL